jgi:hypothetical protein
METSLKEQDLPKAAGGSVRGHLILAEMVNEALTKQKQV